MSPTFRIRPGTLDDLDVLVRPRVNMFTDTGVPLGAAGLDESFRAWLVGMMPLGVYRAWPAETAGGEIAAGGGITILPGPPGPRYLGDRMAFVYNVYMEARPPASRSRRPRHGRHPCLVPRGGVASIALNAIWTVCHSTSP